MVPRENNWDQGESMSVRDTFEHVFSWAAGQTDSDSMELGGGAFGTLIVPSGSALAGKTLQFVAVSASSRYSATPLLSTPIALVAGANPMPVDAIREAGAVGRCLLRVNSAVGSASSLTLLWKS